MDLAIKIRRFKEHQRELFCAQNGFSFIPIPSELENKIIETAHDLTLAQLEQNGVVTNVSFQNGIKIIKS